MLDAGKKFRALRDKKKCSNSCVVRKTKFWTKQKTITAPPLQVKWSVPKLLLETYKLLMVWSMVLNATFNNISVISWRLVLSVDETGIPGENHRPVASHWQTLSHNVVSSTPRHERGSIGTVHCVDKSALRNVITRWQISREPISINSKYSFQ
jgi:hypothetical protein